MIQAFTDLTEDLKIRGINPGFHFMDIEAYTALKMPMTPMKIKYKLVPSRNHIENHVKRAIQSFKNHFIEGLCSVDKDFNLKLWDRLLQQAIISLNLIIQSRTLPQLSAYTHIYGEFDFNCTPLSSPGTRLVIHNSTNNHASWAQHGQDG